MWQEWARTKTKSDRLHSRSTFIYNTITVTVYSVCVQCAPAISYQFQCSDWDGSAGKGETDLEVSIEKCASYWGISLNIFWLFKSFKFDNVFALEEAMKVLYELKLFNATCNLLFKAFHVHYCFVKCHISK